MAPAPPETVSTVPAGLWLTVICPEPVPITGADGAEMSTVHEAVGGWGSTLPAMSVALTETRCEPFTMPVYVFGDAHVAQAAPSSLHSNFDTASDAVNAMLAEVEFVVPCGYDVKVVFGATVSGVAGTVNVVE
jgi:hypothetical protein